MRAATRPTQTTDAPRSRPTMAAAKRCRGGGGGGGVTPSREPAGGPCAAAASPAPEWREQRDLVAGLEHPVACGVHAVDEDDPRGAGFETETLDERAHVRSLGEQEGVLRAAFCGLRLEAGEQPRGDRVSRGRHARTLPPIVAPEAGPAAWLDSAGLSADRVAD